MGKLGEAKTLGGIGSILQLIPVISIFGYILVLIAVKYVSDDLKDKSIFDNMLYAVITGIIGVAVGTFLLITGGFFSLATGGFSMGLAGLAFLVIVWAVLIISAIFIRRSYREVSSRLSISAFGTAGTLYFVGAILTIVLVGFLVLLVAFIFQIIGFFSIRDYSLLKDSEQRSVPVASAPAQPSSAQASTYCTGCGAQLEPGSKFCRNCGKAV